MLPGIDEVWAKAMYWMLYAIGSLMWNIARVLLSVAHFIQSIQEGIVDNIGEFVEYATNALSAPVGIFLILALAALGTWYALNSIVATSKWVDPSRLLTYGLATLFFFSAPVMVVDLLEAVRTSMTQGIEATLLDDAIADMFNMDTGSEDDPLPDAIPDVNSDGIIGTFDLAAYFLSVSNAIEIYNPAFPDDFADTYFPDAPSEIDLSNEDERNEAIQDAQEGINRLFFSFVAIPTAITEHFLWFALTIAAIFLYIGFPIAASLSFFVYTDALFTAYVRQFIKLCIETFISVIIVSFVIGLIAAAAQTSTGLFVGTCFIGTIILLWRIKGAMKLATAAFDMFGGGTLTGGATGKDFRNTATTAVAATAAAVTGGASMAAVGAMALDKKAGESLDMGGSLMGLDHTKSDARTQQLMSLAGYSIGKVPYARAAIETGHEGRAFLRAMRDGGSGEQAADMLDYLRVGSSLSTFGSSPWLAMRTSPSLRQAFDNIGGGTNYPYRAEDGAPVNGGGMPQDPLTAVLTQLLSVLQPNGQAHAPVAYSPSDDTQLPPPNSQPPPPDMPPDDNYPPPGGSPSGQGGAPMDVNVVSSNPDLDGDLRADRAQEQTTVQRQSEAWTSSMNETVNNLADPGSITGAASHQNIVTVAGQQNADALQAAVTQHGAGVVQQATEATVNVVSGYQEQGMSGTAILSAFQSGTGFEAVREQIDGDTPLSDSQLTAVADLVMTPRSDVTPIQLEHTIAHVAAAGGSDKDVLAELGAASHFGSHTGAVRGTIQGAQDMGLSEAQTVEMLANLRQGLANEVRTSLAASGASAQEINNFISDASMLPSTKFQMSQSSAPQEDES